MATNFNIAGGKELALALAKLPVSIEKNIMRGALRAGATVIKDEAKALVSKKTGKLAKSLRVSTARSNKYVEAKVKAGNNNSAFYYRFVEFGTARHDIVPKNANSLAFVAKGGNFVMTKKVKHTGAKAKPFMRPALDKKSRQAIDEVGAYIGKRLTKEGLETSGDFGVDEL